MKRCPKCNAIAPESDRFCDLDGTPLIEEVPPPTSSSNSLSWKIMVIGAVGGAALGVVLFVLYYKLSSNNQTVNQHVSANTGIKQIQPAVLTVPEPAPEASPSPEQSPSPTPSPSTSPSPHPSPSVGLSLTPISTATASATAVTIKLLNGSTIEADEAWVGPEGLWYRKGGVVALLDRAQVKGIERPTPMASPSPK